MKRIIIFLSIILLLSVFYSASPLLFGLVDRGIEHYRFRIGRQLLQHSVIGYWPFDPPTVSDAAGGRLARNDGVLNVEGRYGGARHFLGRPDNVIRTGFALNQLGQSYSISFWIKIIEGESYQPLLRNLQGTVNYAWLESGKIWFRIPGPRHDDAVISCIVKAGEDFHHITLVVDAQGNKACLFENGIERTCISVFKVIHPSDDLAIGQLKSGAVLNYVLDELAFRTRPMSPSEVAQEARAGEPLLGRIAGSAHFKLRCFERVRAALRFVLKDLDLLNPIVGARSAGLPLAQFNFFLSNRDIKHFNLCHHLSLEHGIAAGNLSRSRGVHLDINGKIHRVSMELEDGSARENRGEKKSFTVEFQEGDHFRGAGKLVFIPPESNGFLRPLLRTIIESKVHAGHSRNGLASVWINGRYQGIYLFENSGLYTYSGGKEGILDLVAHVRRFPFTKEEVLAEYDQLVRSIEPWLALDRSSPCSRKEIRYRLAGDRRMLEMGLANRKDGDERSRVSRVRRFLAGNLVLGENPGTEFIISDLDLSIRNLAGVDIEWESLDPQWISAQGRVRRPALGDPVRARLMAHLRFGKIRSRKKLMFTIMPEQGAISAARVWVRGVIPPYECIPCLMEVIYAGDAGKQTGWIPARIKLRGNTALYYPKKSYRIRFDHPRAFFDFAESRDVLLMSSYVDHTFMKNHLAYGLFRDFSKGDRVDHAPRHQFVELFINQEYQGLYEFSENIDASVLGIAAFQPDEKIHSVIYKAEGRDANFAVPSRESYLQREPDIKFGEYWKPYDEFIHLVGALRGKAFRSGVRDAIDLENVADFQILLNLAYSTDGPNHNVFIVRGNKPGDKFFIVPWDYDKSFGGPYDRTLSNHLFGRLMNEIPSYREHLIDRWRELRAGILDEQDLMDRINGLEQTLRVCARRNFQRWPLPEGTSFQQEVGELRSWVRNRLHWMDHYFEELAEAKAS